MPRRAWLECSLAVAVAALGVGSSSCLAVLGGVQDVSVDFKVAPSSDGSFFGWTEITVAGDASSANSATLVAVTLEVEKPAGTADLSFLKSLKGEAVLDKKRTLIVKNDKFPRGEQAVILNVVFKGDLRPFFNAQQTIRIEWTGQTNPAFTAWPADGFWIRGHVKVDIE